MAKAAETYNDDGGTNPHLSLNLSSFSGSLLKNFIAETKLPPKFSDEEDERVELNLSLSLHGRFGLDPARNENFVRSSSIPETMKPCTTDEATSASMTWTPIVRTSSLAMEECKTRKQMQSLRRMEAKRKRNEKQRNNMKKKVVHCRTKTGHEPKSENENVWVGSQGSGSSGISEFDSQSIRATDYPEVRSPPSPPTQPSSTSNGNVLESSAKDVSMRKVLLSMPCVSTTGDGPTGRRVEGFLYRYRKGEEVKIVCVCHGSVLSPAEFVKHAGGRDVVHPLKHIVITPSPFA